MSPDLLDRALAGDVRALARVMSWIENQSEAGRAALARCYPRAGRARTLGLTGPPGVGKSTLTDRLTQHWRARGLRVAVIAVDPSSPFTGGAILGDRIRMIQHFTDPGVYIRSMATRGHLGGLAPATADAIDLLDACGYDVILVETIGVGQDDIEVTGVVPCVLLVSTPGLGDEIQVMKAGIMEAGDIHVINKADLPGADRVEMAIRASLSIAGLESERPIVRTVAATGEGIAELAAAVEGFDALLGEDGRRERALARARGRVSAIVSATLLARVRSSLAAEGLWQKLAARVSTRELDPYAAASEILSAGS